MGRLDGRVAIVTGGSRGIGRAVASAFSREGAHVAITGVADETALRDAEAEVSSSGGEVLAVMADVKRRAEIDSLVHRVIESWGRIDILVNNAGIIRPTLLEKITEDQWDEMMAVHLKGAFICTQAVLAAMKGQGRGKIINVSAPSALGGSTGVADYAAAKGGIISLTRSAAEELKPHNIQVNCISPVADTRMIDDLMAFRRRHMDDAAAASSLAGVVSPEAVAPAFVFFACGDSDHITGQILAFNRNEYADPGSPG
jgi:3-oxoacyl-[acyl-carrier protein] reductase